MQLKCPACNAGFSLEAALAVDAARSALLTALQMLPSPLGSLLVQYLGMFRAAGRALSFERVDKLLGELKPMFESGTVTRNGLSRPCPLTYWQQGIEKMIELRNNDKLQLPLKTHGYLLEIVSGLAEQAGAREEKMQETQRRVGANRDKADRNLQRIEIIGRVRADRDLGLLTQEEAERTLRNAGIDPEEVL